MRNERDYRWPTFVFLLIVGMLFLASELRRDPKPSPTTISDPLLLRISTATSSGTVNEVMALLPEIENLWDQKPKVYFQYMNEVAEGIQGKVEMKEVFLRLLEQVIQKPWPQDMGQALDCSFYKKEIALKGSPPCYRERRLAIALAKLLGEIRSRKIPSIQGFHGSYSGWPDRLTPEEKEQQKRNDEIDHYARCLSSHDETIVRVLVSACAQIRWREGREGDDFISEVTSLAHLTEKDLARFKEVFHKKEQFEKARQSEKDRL